MIKIIKYFYMILHIDFIFMIFFFENLSLFYLNLFQQFREKYRCDFLRTAHQMGEVGQNGLITLQVRVYIVKSTLLLITRFSNFYVKCKNKIHIFSEKCLFSLTLTGNWSCKINDFLNI